MKVYIVTLGYVEDEKFVAFLDVENARRYAEREGYEVLDPIEVLDAPVGDITVVPWPRDVE